MIDVDLLCEFLANPFGDEKKAREFLSEIGGRPPSDAELARGLFCFQLAFYFLACFAITTRIDDSSLQTEAIDQLNARVRAFYAREGSRVQFSEFVVSPDERDRFISVLHQQLNQTRLDATPPAETMLALFDFVVVHRLREYVDAMGQSNGPRRLYLVAEKVLFHYGAQNCHPAAVGLIANLLAAGHDAVSATVAPDLHAVDAPRIDDTDTETDTDTEADTDAVMPMPFSQRMPNIVGKRPIKTYLAGAYVLRLVEDIGPVGGRAIIRYRYVLALSDKRTNLPVCFVALENSSSISNVLGVFEQNGSHSNYGVLQGRDLLPEFMTKGMSLIMDRFHLSEIEELVPRSQGPSRRKFWQGKGAVARTAA